MCAYTSYRRCGLICGSLHVPIQLYVLLTLSPVWWLPFLSPLWCLLALPSPSFLQDQPLPACSKSWNSSSLSPQISFFLNHLDCLPRGSCQLLYVQSCTVWVQSRDQSHVKKGNCSTKNSWELDHKEGWVWRIDAFELWCWGRLLRVPWTARRSNEWMLMEISPEYSLEGLILKLKLQYFGHLMRRTDLLEKTLML